jgi:hypothetical protein
MQIRCCCFKQEQKLVVRGNEVNAYRNATPWSSVGTVAHFPSGHKISYAFVDLSTQLFYSHPWVVAPL